MEEELIRALEVLTEPGLEVFHAYLKFKYVELIGGTIGVVTAVGFVCLMFYKLLKEM